MRTCLHTMRTRVRSLNACNYSTDTIVLHTLLHTTGLLIGNRPILLLPNPHMAWHDASITSRHDGANSRVSIGWNPKGFTAGWQTPERIRGRAPSKRIRTLLDSRGAHGHMLHGTTARRRQSMQDRGRQLKQRHGQTPRKRTGS